MRGADRPDRASGVQFGADGGASALAHASGGEGKGLRHGQGHARPCHLGGTGEDFATGIDVDATGVVTIAGRTNSADLPVSNAVQPALRGSNDAFVAPIEASCTGSLALSPPSLASGSQGSPYTSSLTASGGTPPYAFSLVGGALPPGLTLGPSGVVSGTPAVAGTFGFSIRAADDAGACGTLACRVVPTGESAARLTLRRASREEALVVLPDPRKYLLGS